MREIVNTRSHNGKKSQFELERQVRDGNEVFDISSCERLPKKLWRPKYTGQLALKLYVARVDISGTTFEHAHERRRIIVGFGPEHSIYSKSRSIEERYWAASMASYVAVSSFLTNDFGVDERAEWFYNSLTPEQHESINAEGVAAEDISFIVKSA